MQDTRTEAQRRFHYEFEKKLAQKLINSSLEERKFLYKSVYEDLFNTVLDHPQLVRKTDPAVRQRQLARDAAFLKSFVRPEANFLEIGAGDCALTRLMAPACRHAHAIDVSPTIAAGDSLPANASFHLTDGLTLPIDKGSIGMAYSNQVIEHLHPDDFEAHLDEVARVLAPGACYVIATPHRFAGPHDISMHYDPVATGLHLREYTRLELARLLQRHGYNAVRFIMRFKGMAIRVPRVAMVACEAAFALVPQRLRRKLAELPVLRNVLDAYVVGYA